MWKAQTDHCATRNKLWGIWNHAQCSGEGKFEFHKMEYFDWFLFVFTEMSHLHKKIHEMGLASNVNLLQKNNPYLHNNHRVQDFPAANSNSWIFTPEWNVATHNRFESYCLLQPQCFANSSAKRWQKCMDCTDWMSIAQRYDLTNVTHEEPFVQTWVKQTKRTSYPFIEVLLLGRYQLVDLPLIVDVFVDVLVEVVYLIHQKLHVFL